MTFDGKNNINGSIFTLNDRPFQENETIVETATTTTDQVENKSTEVVKTFTQEEVNGIVKDRLAKAQKGIPSKEELSKYNKRIRKV